MLLLPIFLSSCSMLNMGLQVRTKSYPNNSSSFESVWHGEFLYHNGKEISHLIFYEISPDKNFALYSNVTGLYLYSKKKSFKKILAKNVLGDPLEVLWLENFCMVKIRTNEGVQKITVNLDTLES